MCHVMLPSRSLGHWAVLDGRYADEAFAMMVERIRAKGTQPGEYQAKLFGGGNMFPMIKPAKPGQSVAQKNIEACRRLAVAHGLQVYVEEVGGAASRSLVFDLRTGDVMVRKSALLSNRSELENHSR
jgi:chemotaxis protein CheD